MSCPHGNWGQCSDCDQINEMFNESAAKVAALNARIAELERELAQRREAEEWKPIESAPKGRKIIAGYFNSLGNWRTITACYYHTLEQEDPDSEDEFAPEGWYEESDSLEQIARTSEEPTHWRPLPPPPALASSRTDKERGK